MTSKHRMKHQNSNPTKAIRVRAEARRYEMLELTKAGATEREIAAELGVSKQLVHKEVKRVLSDLAKDAAHTADSVRALQMERDTTLLSKWWSGALHGDETSTRMVLSIMHKISEINGVIPDKPLITIDQRAIHLSQGEVTFSIEASNNATNDSADNQIPTTEPVQETGRSNLQ